MSVVVRRVLSTICFKRQLLYFCEYMYLNPTSQRCYLGNSLHENTKINLIRLPHGHQGAWLIRATEETLKSPLKPPIRIWQKMVIR